MASASASNSTPGLPHISLGLTLGPIEVGILLSTLLYGTALVQTYLYIINYAHDRRWIKAVVGAVFSFETLHTLCTWAYLYYLTVTNFGNAAALNNVPWYFGLTIPLQAFAGSIVQAFFSYRVQVLSRRWWLVAPVYAALLMRAVLGVTGFVLILGDKDLPTFHAKHGLVADISWIGSMVSDIWNTFLLCIYLRNHRSQYAKTQSTVHRIMLWTIETGICTTMLAVLLVAFFVAMPQNGIWVCLNIIYPKLYPNSLLVSLNSRAALREEGISAELVARTFNFSGAPNATVISPPHEEQSGAVRLQTLRSPSETRAPFDDYK